MSRTQDSYLQSAFDAVCKEAKKPEGFYVVLMERAPFYGGPEEGGWWGSDRIVTAYQHFTTEEAANAAKDQVEKLAKELSEESKKEFGKQCLREMNWLEARGLEADFLREPDGDSEYYVVVTEELPQNNYDTRHYE